MSPATAARRRLIRKLISKGDITSQARLVELLAGEGFSVTQATVSRDLDALGAVKVENSNGVESYTTAVDRPVLSEAEARLRRSVSDFVDEKGDIVVVRTPPGAAHLVASAIDTSDMKGVLGTVAGDDTLIVIAAPDLGGAEVAAKIEQIGAG